MLQELHRAGLLDDDELAAKRAALDERSRSSRPEPAYRQGRGSTAREPGPREKVRTAVSPQSSSRQMYVSAVTVLPFER